MWTPILIKFWDELIFDENMECDRSEQAAKQLVYNRTLGIYGNWLYHVNEIFKIFQSNCDSSKIEVYLFCSLSSLKWYSWSYFCARSDFVYFTRQRDYTMNNEIQFRSNNKIVDWIISVFSRWNKLNVQIWKKICKCVSYVLCIKTSYVIARLMGTSSAETFPKWENLLCWHA